MLVTYICSKCDGKRFLTSVIKAPVLCKQCNESMYLKQDNISTDSQTTEEARFLADEALYNTIGDRISKKHRVKHL